MKTKDPSTDSGQVRLKMLTVAVHTPDWAPMAEAWNAQLLKLGVSTLTAAFSAMPPEALWLERLKLVRKCLVGQSPVLMCDLDTRWFEDPRDEILQVLAEGSDIVAMAGFPPTWQPWAVRGFTLCCGFMAFAPNDRVRAFLGAVIGRLEAKPHERDQYVLNALLFDELWNQKIKVAALDPERFSRQATPCGDCQVWHPLVRRPGVEARMAALGFGGDAAEQKVIDKSKAEWGRMMDEL